MAQLGHSRAELRPRESGFSLLELLVVVALMAVVTAVALPMFLSVQRNYRLISDARAIAGQLALARMRAANDFNQAEIVFDTSANTYQLKVYNKSTSAFDTTEGAVYKLSSGNTFSFGAITLTAGTQASIAESSPIIFNSRGIPILSNGTATGSYSVYLADNKGGYCAVAVSPSSKIKIYRYSGGQWVAL
jgi:prepilin-type N-terminal cleavage/methylation domain-containing protein